MKIYILLFCLMSFSINGETVDRNLLTDNILTLKNSLDKELTVNSNNINSLSSISSNIKFSYIETFEGGYQNCQINAGCEYNLVIAVENQDIEKVENVRGVLKSLDPNISICSDTIIFGEINSYDTSISINSVKIAITENLVDNYEIPLILLCINGEDRIYISNFNIKINSPILELSAIVRNDNKDNILYIQPCLENIGSGTIHDLELILRTNDPNVTILDSTEKYTELEPFEIYWLDSAFKVIVGPSCHSSGFIDVELNASMSGGYIYIDTFTFNVGENFIEDFENNRGTWSYSGMSSWHIANSNFKSTFHSMYCGNDNTLKYSNSIINSRIITPAFPVVPGSRMSFWHFYELEDGYDKVQLQMSTDNGNNWVNINPDEGYDRTWNYEPYDSIYTGKCGYWKQQHITFNILGNVNICWLFFSDANNTRIGYYFDDINVNFKPCFSALDEELISSNDLQINDCALVNVYPNPVKTHAIFEYFLDSEVNLNLTIFDAMGREIKTLINQTQMPGMYRIEWDSRDIYNNLVPSGTYFYIIDAGYYKTREKLIVIR